MKPLVIYHKNCTDGFGAAWVFWHKFRNSVDYHAASYGSSVPDVTGRVVYCVDFSYPPQETLEILARCERLVMLDHHEQAIMRLRGIDSIAEHSRFEDRSSVAHSGATLAWQHLFPGLPPPRLLAHIQDRDLWRFKLDGSREIHASLGAEDQTFENWDQLMMGGQVGASRLHATGLALLRKEGVELAQILKSTTRTMVIAGVRVPCANVPGHLASEAGHQLGAGQPFAATYYDTETHRQFSLRSAEGGADVAAIAAKFGGGGHPHAAGFRVPREHELARC
jgi:oligoribonuclease NrnB/cAMP/cGMP phosphodiesterase (DHH superfamily)